MISWNEREREMKTKMKQQQGRFGRTKWNENEIYWGEKMLENHSQKIYNQNSTEQHQRPTSTHPIRNTCYRSSYFFAFVSSAFSFPILIWSCCSKQNMKFLVPLMFYCLNFVRVCENCLLSMKGRGIKEQNSIHFSFHFFTIFWCRISFSFLLPTKNTQNPIQFFQSTMWDLLLH